VSSRGHGALTAVSVTCGVCGNPGPWEFSLRWYDESAHYEVPGGITVWMEPQPRVAPACSFGCAKKFAKASDGVRISITRPETDQRWARYLTNELSAGRMKTSGEEDTPAIPGAMSVGTRVTGLAESPETPRRPDV
jgi:hypothetical protein